MKVLAVKPTAVTDRICIASPIKDLIHPQGTLGTPRPIRWSTAGVARLTFQNREYCILAQTNIVRHNGQTTLLLPHLRADVCAPKQAPQWINFHISTVTCTQTSPRFPI